MHLAPLRRSLLVAVAVLTALGGCATSAPAPADGGALDRDALVGRWQMAQILDEGVDVSAEANPAGDRYIALFADGTFESGGQPYGRNTGRWTYNPRTRRFGIDSDLGPDDDSVWTLTLRGPDVMLWDGAGSAFSRRFRIVSHRVE